MPRGKQAKAPSANPSTSIQRPQVTALDTSQANDWLRCRIRDKHRPEPLLYDAQHGLKPALLKPKRSRRFLPKPLLRDRHFKAKVALSCYVQNFHLQRLQDAKPASRPTTQSTRKADADFKKNQTKSLADSRKTKKAPPKYATDSLQTSLRKSRSGKPRLTKGAAKSSKSTWNKKTHISSVAEQEEASPPSESSQARTRRNLLDLPTEEVPQPATSSRALSEQALQELTRGLKSIEEARRRNGGIDLPDGSFEEPDSEQGSAEAGLDPWTAFTHKWGYLPPLDDEASKILIAIIENPNLAKSMARISASDSSEFEQGLQWRNVPLSSAEGIDAHAEKIRSLKGDDWHEPTNEKECFDLLWKLDKEKCHVTSSEALFQRTLMINLIARHFLIYPRNGEDKQIFDFSVEEAWTCLPMPTRAVAGIRAPTRPDQKFLCQPKPDLALCFNRRNLISEKIWRVLPRATQALACVENMCASRNLVFPFLSVEAKSAVHGLDDQKALRQSLNNASQALFNMYEFFRDAEGDKEKFFYEKVRFFSIVAVRDGILVRVHRAIKIPPDDFSTLLVIPEEDSYRLYFEYREYARIMGIDHFDREKVLNILKPIMQYAMNELGKELKSAAESLAKKLSEKPERFRARQNLNFYRYGQPSPATVAISRRASAAPSTNGGQKSVNGASNDGGTGEARAQKPPEVPTFPSSAGPSKKRTQSVMDTDEDSNNAGTQESTGSKRHQASFQSDRMSYGG
ncbi:MAG: hypothetical protein L6R42_003713 [Xanthoria sp. 1 TBL-2021]|nr:MAG: hypothetical protein L6R42_003713 [Xanthoria sp. 1 TBL-2021]